MRTRSHIVRSLLLISLVSGCVAASGGERPKGNESSIADLSVGNGARGGSCSPNLVRGLVEQIVAEVDCDQPGLLVRVDAIGGLTLGEQAAAAPYLHRDVVTALRTALASGEPLTLKTGLRLLPQRYLRDQWSARGRCGVRPDDGHEGGTGIDIEDPTAWQSRLGVQGFRWAGAGDPEHFTFPGASSVEGPSIAAFQRLWNRNHPDDTIAQSGAYDAATQERLRRSPSEGFPVGARCETPPPAEPPADPTPAPGSDAGTPDGGGTDAGTPMPPAPPPPPPAPTSPCDAGHGDGCAVCNSVATECGWCGATSRCVPGSEFGPDSEACPSDWEWTDPAYCSVGGGGAAPPPPPPSGGGYGGMCHTRAQACAPGDCCAGLECRRGVSFGVQCCGAARTACSSGSDCCGYMDCVAGSCQCRSVGRACLDDRDCCSGSCGGGTCR